MRSITKADLDNLVRRLNIEKKNKPTRTIGRYKNGKFKSDKWFHISSAYGGVQLVFSKKDSSAESSVTQGYVSKRELFDQINAILSYRRF